MDWQKYQEKVDRFFEAVDNDLLESDRLMQKMPSSSTNSLFFFFCKLYVLDSAREILSDIRQNVTLKLKDNVENIETTLAELDEDENESDVEENKIEITNDEQTAGK